MHFRFRKQFNTVAVFLKHSVRFLKNNSLSEKIFRYLKDQGDDAASACYDVKYALRLCLGYDKNNMLTSLRRACVKIYSVLKLYEEAVSMALKVMKMLWCFYSTRFCCSIHTLVSVRIKK